MWNHNIGGYFHFISYYCAASNDLLDAVFAHVIPLQMWKECNLVTGPPVSVLVVVRHHDEESDVSNMRHVSLEDLANIWDTLCVNDAAFSVVFLINMIVLRKTLCARGECTVANDSFFR